MARETINGISVPIPGTGEPADFVSDLRRIATDLSASIAAQVPGEVADALADPDVTTVVTDAVDTAVDDYLAGASPLGTATLDGGYLNLPGGAGNYTNTPDRAVTVGTGLVVAASGDTITKTAHGLFNGEVVQLSAITGAAGLSAGVDYFVVGATANTFQVSASYGGSAVDVTSDGTATVTAYPLRLLGDFDLRITATIPTLGSGFQTLIARRSANTSISWRLNGSGGTQALTSTNGTTVDTDAAGASVPAGPPRLRLTRRASDGRLQFFYADAAGAVTTTDGEKWTQLGSDQTGVLGKLFSEATSLSIGGLNDGTNPLTGKVFKAEMRSGIDGTLVASPDFRGKSGSTFVDTQGNTWTVRGTATLVAPTASLTKGTSTVTLATTQALDTELTARVGKPNVGSVPVNPLTGCYHPEAFGPCGATATAEQQRAAVQAAVDAAYAAGGGDVFLGRLYTVGVNPAWVGSSYGARAIITRANVGFRGTNRRTTGLKLATGANCHLVAGPVDLDGSGDEKSTAYVSFTSMMIDGYRAGQTAGARTYDGLHLRRHAYLRIHDVEIRECAGNGYFSSGGTDTALSTKTVVRGIQVTNLHIDGCSAWGLFSSSTNRDIAMTNVMVERCGHTDYAFPPVGLTSNEYGGAFLDHSEGIYNGLFAYQNFGDGIYIHNVTACHYDNLHAIGNAGYGIYAESMVDTSGWGWQAGGNCAAPFGASYRDGQFDPTGADSAEIVISNGGSYGPTKNTHIGLIHAPGTDPAFSNGTRDGVKHGIIIDSVVEATFTIGKHIYGTGSWGAKQVPAQGYNLDDRRSA